MTWPDVHYKKLTVPAWVKTPCEGCSSSPVRGQPYCPGDDECKLGEEGKWHESIHVAHDGPKLRAWTIIKGIETPDNEPFKHLNYIPVTCSTILFQLYDPCGVCGGSAICMKPKFRCFHSDPKQRCEYSDGVQCLVDACPHCLKDSDGNSTGAAEGSGQGWKIEEDEG